MTAETKRERRDRHLLVVRADEVENKTTVHERKQVIEEEGQTAVQPLHQLNILPREDGKRGRQEVGV